MKQKLEGSDVTSQKDLDDIFFERYFNKGQLESTMDELELA